MDYKDSALLLLSTLGKAYQEKKVKLVVMEHEEGGVVPVIVIKSDYGDDLVVAAILSDDYIDYLKKTSEEYSLDEADQFTAKISNQYAETIAGFVKEKKTSLIGSSKDELIDKLSSKPITTDKKKLN